MIGFPERIVNDIYRLREHYKSRKTCVVVSYPIIEILKYDRDREISIKLFYDNESGTFSIQPPDVKFYQKISHYDFSTPERRRTRDKNLLFTVVRELRKCGLWDLVSNKDFIILNSFNKKVDRKELLRDLRGIINPEI